MSICTGSRLLAGGPSQDGSEFVRQESDDMVHRARSEFVPQNVHHGSDCSFRFGRILQVGVMLDSRDELGKRQLLRSSAGIPALVEDASYEQWELCSNVG